MDECFVDLYWIPVGAGTPRLQQLSLRAWEAVEAARARRPRQELLHSALKVRPGGGETFTVELTPAFVSAPVAPAATGAVGFRGADKLRLFRYQLVVVPGEVLPDEEWAVGPATRLTTECAVVKRVVDLGSTVPRYVWGRRAAGTKEMWTSDSVIAWLLVRAGLEMDGVGPPAGGRAAGLGRWQGSRRTRVGRRCRRPTELSIDGRRGLFRGFAVPVAVAIAVAVAVAVAAGIFAVLGGPVDAINGGLGQVERDTAGVHDRLAAAVDVVAGGGVFGHAASFGLAVLFAVFSVFKGLFAVGIAVFFVFTVLTCGLPVLGDVVDAVNGRLRQVERDTAGVFYHAAADVVTGRGVLGDSVGAFRMFERLTGGRFLGIGCLDERLRFTGGAGILVEGFSEDIGDWKTLVEDGGVGRLRPDLKGRELSFEQLWHVGRLVGHANIGSIVAGVGASSHY